MATKRRRHYVQKGYKMTTREFYQAVANSSNLSAEMTEKASELLAAMDARNEKRKSTDTKEKKEAIARRESVLAFLEANECEVFTRDQIAENLGMTPSQATAACKALGEIITKSEAKIGKSKKVVYQYHS